MDLLVNIDVADLPRAEAFYTSAFDLKPARRFGREVVELMGSSSPIYLLAKAPGSNATGAPGTQRQYSRHWTPVHLDFVVADMELALGKALAAGAVLERPVASRRWGKLAVLADPFGNGFCLVQFLGRGYDEIADRESA